MAKFSNLILVLILVQISFAYSFCWWNCGDNNKNADFIDTNKNDGKNSFDI